MQINISEIKNPSVALNLETVLDGPAGTLYIDSDGDTGTTYIDDDGNLRFGYFDSDGGTFTEISDNTIDECLMFTLAPVGHSITLQQT